MLTRFVHRVANAGAEELKGFGLSPAQFQMLMAIRARPGIAQKDLAEAFGVTPGNISQLVKKSEDAGLIVRVRLQATDELELSPAGRALLGAVEPAHVLFMQRTFAALSPTEQEQLHALITKLSAK